jgi:predicted transcriptional regulator
VEPNPTHTYADAGNYSVNLTVSDGIKTYSFSNVVSVQNGVGSRSGEGGHPVISVGGNAHLYVMVSVLVLCVVGIFLGGTEMGLYAIFPFFVWLYTKIKNVEVLDHYLRGKIHGYIIANPGEHYNQIKDALCLNNGSLAYHLRVLEREGYVKSLREGVYKRFYPASATMPADRLTPMERLIIREIKDKVGITQKEIAERIEESPQVVNYHIKNMESKGVVRLERYGRETLCYSAEDYVPRHPWEKIET